MFNHLKYEWCASPRTKRDRFVMFLRFWTNKDNTKLSTKRVFFIGFSNELHQTEVGVHFNQNQINQHLILKVESHWAGTDRDQSVTQNYEKRDFLVVGSLNCERLQPNDQYKWKTPRKPSKGWCPGDILIRRLNHLNQIHPMWRSGGSPLSSSWMTDL